jgi:putative ABC transport system permease protein
VVSALENTISSDFASMGPVLLTSSNTKTIQRRGGDEREIINPIISYPEQSILKQIRLSFTKLPILYGNFYCRGKNASDKTDPEIAVGRIFYDNSV